MNHNQNSLSDQHNGMIEHVDPVIHENTVGETQNILDTSLLNLDYTISPQFTLVSNSPFKKYLIVHYMQIIGGHSNQLKLVEKLTFLIIFADQKSKIIVRLF